MKSYLFRFCALLMLIGGTDGVAQESPAVRGFVSVEPYELRIEALIEVQRFAEVWGIRGEALAGAGREEILAKAMESLQEGVILKEPVLKSSEMDLQGRFIVFDSEKGFVTDERKQIPLDEAIIGMTMAFGVAGLDRFEMEWLLYGPGQDRVAIEVFSSGAPSGRFVTLEKPQVSWESNGDVSATPEVPVPSVSRTSYKSLSWLRIPALLVVVFGVGAFIRYGRKTPAWGSFVVVFGLGALILAVKVKSDRVAVLEKEELEDVVYGLLRNVYRSFEFRDESEIYDELDKSIEGYLLERVYLEIRGSLELENAGGPRVRVYEVALRDVVDEARDPNGLQLAKAEWVTIGQVTHWGHTHERTNKYEARFHLVPVEEHWKIGELELLSEEREQKVSRSEAASSE